ncbi:unnamed protein product, partial [Owenia fusiformis]
MRFLGCVSEKKLLRFAIILTTGILLYQNISTLYDGSHAVIHKQRPTLGSLGSDICHSDDANLKDERNNELTDNPTKKEDSYNISITNIEETSAHNTNQNERVGDNIMISNQEKLINQNMNKIDTKIPIDDADFICKNVELKDIFKEPFPLCLHSAQRDKYVSGAFLENGYWERSSVNKILKTLEQHPSWGFVDVGANIGTYTIPILKLGRKVVAIEALKRNIIRITRSAQLSDLHDNLTLLHNAVY